MYVGNGNQQIKMNLDRAGREMTGDPYHAPLRSEVLEMKKGWCYDEDRKWRYYKKDGSMLTGWQKLSDSIIKPKKWYYFDTDGGRVSGKQNIDGKEYEFSSVGVLISNNGKPEI